uniref:Transposase MuDR plant domain-containing protein n=1 Tax=Noccaea caerulescens TaxID=107243 RepID=A0A1J3IMA2_NOCCA
MVEIYSVCGEWKFNDNLPCEFVVDPDKGASFCEVDENVTYLELLAMVIQDFGIDCSVKNEDIKLSYEHPLKMKSVAGNDFPPIFVRNDRHVRYFINKIKEVDDLIRLCVTVSKSCDEIIPVENVASSIQSKTMDDEEDRDVESSRRAPVLQILNGDDPNVNESNAQQGLESDMSDSAAQNKACSIAEKESQPILLHPAPDLSPGFDRATDDIHVNKCFKNKQELMFKMRRWALKWKFEFRTRWSDKSRVMLGCVDDKCSWKMRATRIDSSGAFLVKRYVHEHTCDPTQWNVNHRQATAKLLGALISRNYGEKKDGLKPKQIIEQVKKEHGIEIKYKQAWRIKEQAQNLMRGTPDLGTETLSAPPITRQSSERPPEKRRRSVGESGKVVSKPQKHKCSKCGGEGHNKSTCVVSIS